jgi:aspartate oxidase
VSNLAAVAGALLRAADARLETRGAHARVEYPDQRPEWRRRVVHGRIPGAPAPAVDVASQGNR